MQMDSANGISDMLDHDAGMLNGLDMNELIPMDLDLSLPTDDDSVPFVTNSGHAQPSIEASESAAFALQQQDNGVMSGAGAGPLPTGFGIQPTQSSGSTLTEFTKRRNWSQRVLEELKDFGLQTEAGLRQDQSPTRKWSSIFSSTVALRQVLHLDVVMNFGPVVGPPS